MRLSEIRDEQALDVLADVLEPLENIIADEEIKESYKRDGFKMKFVAKLIKTHKRDVIEILARLDMKEPDDYSFSILSVPARVLEILNDPEFVSLFTSPVTKTG
jgi:hypothetical protein